MVDLDQVHLHIVHGIPLNEENPSRPSAHSVETLENGFRTHLVSRPPPRGGSWAQLRQERAEVNSYLTFYVPGFTLYGKVEIAKGFSNVFYSMSTPIDEENTKLYLIAFRNFMLEPDKDKDHLDRNLRNVYQDKAIAENHFPKRAPDVPEWPVINVDREDLLMQTYWRLMRQLRAKGWQIDRLDAGRTGPQWRSPRHSQPGTPRGPRQLGLQGGPAGCCGPVGSAARYTGSSDRAHGAVTESERAGHGYDERAAGRQSERHWRSPAACRPAGCPCALPAAPDRHRPGPVRRRRAPAGRRPGAGGLRARHAPAHPGIPPHLGRHRPALPHRPRCVPRRADRQRPAQQRPGTARLPAIAHAVLPLARGPQRGAPRLQQPARPGFRLGAQVAGGLPPAVALAARPRAAVPERRRSRRPTTSWRSGGSASTSRASRA